MPKSNLSTKSVTTFALLAIILASNSVVANVYKWRDLRGRTQYSDTPPSTSYSTVSRSELVNALQSKDMCTLPSTKIQSKVPQLSANFNFKMIGAIQNPVTSADNQNALAFRQNSPVLSVNRSQAKTIVRSLAPKMLPQNNRPTFTATKPQGNSASPINTIPVAIAAITKFVASHSMPSVISPAAANTAVKALPIAVNPVSAPLTTSPATTATAPTTVAVNLPHNIVQAALMPAVDISKNMTPAVGFNDLRLEPTTEKPTLGTDGAFRIGCAPSHMSNDDPIVYPNQPGAAHHHTFFGNTSTNAKSDMANIRALGNSTCNGGVMNKSSYWIPSMIDTATNAPIKPDGSLVYYKAGDLGFKSDELVTPPPKGLRMISGNSKGQPGDGNAWDGHYTCTAPDGNTLPWSKTIPNCNIGDVLSFHVSFPQCWDGTNLDSPDHKSHMAERQYISHTSIEMRCPSTHPVRIPAITLNVYYTATKANQMLNWRLASDNYPTKSPGGSSLHADWVNGWDEKLLAVVVKNCIQSRNDCHAHLTGDGKKMF